MKFIFNRKVIRKSLIVFVAVISTSYLFYYTLVPKKLSFVLYNSISESKLHLEISGTDVLYSDSIQYSMFPQVVFVEDARGIVDFEVKITNKKGFSFEEKNSINMIANGNILIFLSSYPENDDSFGAYIKKNYKKTLFVP